MLSIRIKYFDELSINELYELLRLRSEVFVVEQDCVYQDIDSKDQKAVHVLGYDNNKLVAYTRLFKPGDYFNESSIGRVVVREKARGSGAGYDIMNASITFINDVLKKFEIRISAQTYLKKFYNNLGFKEVGEGYLEDGIPHINMIRN
ncbi:GNAT family N-acetyltransferase [Winogradskyella aurantiaca]|uniref:GNAT family N-acetyltransferase n=1 Tax=Winogradskyella aurantiaca TaxID=2219558 RepID=UPI000E1CA0AE|nr:GNAT family N-acetyltransferase [Winogradskyella aurantiaca]